MSTTYQEKRWSLHEAEQVADELGRLLAPYCERIAVAGSIRRKQPQVKDIELLCISKVASSTDMFGRMAADHYGLDAILNVLFGEGMLRKRPNRDGRYTYGPQNKYLVDVPSGIPVDVFSTTVENWGMSLVVRTGPKDFNIRMMARFRELEMRGHAYGGVTDQEGNEIECRDEETVFHLLGWPWVSPERRY